jgi:hypothetical protein
MQVRHCVGGLRERSEAVAKIAARPIPAVEGRATWALIRTDPESKKRAHI